MSQYQKFCDECRQARKSRMLRPAVLALVILIFATWDNSHAQLQQSGGAGGSTNLSQVGGTATSVNNGASDAGTLRVTLANNSTGQVALAAGIAAVGSITNTAFGITGPLPAGANYIGAVKMIPQSGCAGTALQDLTQVDVPVTATLLTSATDTCVFAMFFTNKTASSITVTVTDNSATPVSYSTNFSIPANSTLRLPFDGMKFLLGVKLTASAATGLNARLIGVQ